jgi:hypothetical protein
MLLSFLGVAYVSAVDVFGLRCIVDCIIFKVRVACCVANDAPSRLSYFISRVFFTGLW